MTNNEFERIKSLIAKAEKENARCEGQIDQLKSNWKKQYGTSDVNKVKERLSAMEDELKEAKARLSELEGKLRGACDWDSIAERLGA